MNTYDVSVEIEVVIPVEAKTKKEAEALVDNFILLLSEGKTEILDYVNIEIQRWRNI